MSTQIHQRGEGLGGSIAIGRPTARPPVPDSPQAS
jgi:hypothetical protein